MLYIALKSPLKAFSLEDKFIFLRLSFTLIAPYDFIKSVLSLVSNVSRSINVGLSFAAIIFSEWISLVFNMFNKIIENYCSIN